MAVVRIVSCPIRRAGIQFRAEHVDIYHRIERIRLIAEIIQLVQCNQECNSVGEIVRAAYFPALCPGHPH